MAGVAGAIGVAVVAGALALGGGGDGSGDKDDTAGAGPTPTTPEATTTTEAAEDPLCVAHDQLVAVVERLGPIDGPADFEAFAGAQLTFTTAAAGIEPGAFGPMADYWQQVHDFYGGRGWDQQVDIGDAALVPRPPSEAEVAAELLAARCGVTAPVDIAP